MEKNETVRAVLLVVLTVVGVKHTQGDFTSLLPTEL